MIRRPTYAAALILTIVLCGTISAGPAFADDPEPPAPSMVQPDLTPTNPTPTNPTPTTEPAPEPVVTPTTPAPSQPSPVTAAGDGLPDLRVSAVYDKPTYDARDEIGITITVVNVGSAPATGLFAIVRGDLSLNHWGELGGPDHRLGPGSSTTAFSSGTLIRLAADMVLRTPVEVGSNEQDANPADNAVTITAPVTQVGEGGFAGTVYGDRNRNNAIDPGELLGGVTVYLSGGGTPHRSLSQQTDSHGRFAFRDIPTGTYSTGFSLAGWAIPGNDISVDGVDDPELVIRATQHVSEILRASIAFTKNAYSNTEVIHLIVTLTNSGPAPLADIIAYCTGFGSNEWGDLAYYGGAGVTMPARSKRTFDVPGPVPELAAALGYLDARCEFGLRSVEGTVVATAFARVPGRVAREVHSSLRHLIADPGCPITAPCGRPPSHPVPDAKVYIRSPFDGGIVARAVTNGNGEFQFANIPVGRYDFGVVGPWKAAPGYRGEFHVSVDADDRVSVNTVYVVPGPNRPDPDTVTPVPPAPQAGVGPAGDTEQLAWTGVNVIWLAIGGLLSLVTGFVLALRGVRRNLPLAE
jgi:hypothetical protein